MANNSDCWARIDKEVASQDQTLNIFFTENETDYLRTVKIRVSSEDGSIEKFYTLVQKKRIKEFFENVEMSETFTKNDCDPEFEKGTEVVYTVPEATYISKVSQENADDQARQDIELNGQKYANEHGECVTIKWLNRAATRTMRKNNCDPDTEEGSLETMTVPAAMFESYVSQADADDQAEKYLDQEAQGYANEHGHCTTIKWYNTEKSGKFTRNDCDVTQEGGEVTYVVEAGTYSSNVSQEDADAKAQADVDANGQAYANTVGECKTVLWYSEERSCTKTKNDCPEDYEGTEWTYEVPAGKYSSIISQADANSKADADIEKNCQAAVNENATCTTIRWWNTKQQKEFTKNDCDSDTQKGSTVTMVVDAHTFSSDVSQQDADQKAIDYLNANGQNYANENGHCSEIKWYNTEQRGSATKDDCDVDERGTEVEYVVPAGKYTSTISQADADQKAKDDVEANRQEYANEHGECVRALWYSVRKECTKTKNDCPEDYEGTEWTYEQANTLRPSARRMPTRRPRTTSIRTARPWLMAMPDVFPTRITSLVRRHSNSRRTIARSTILVPRLLFLRKIRKSPAVRSSPVLRRPTRTPRPSLRSRHKARPLPTNVAIARKTRNGKASTARNSPRTIAPTTVLEARLSLPKKTLPAIHLFPTFHRKRLPTLRKRPYKPKVRLSPIRRATVLGLVLIPRNSRKTTARQAASLRA